MFAAYAVAFNIIFGSTGQLFLCVGALAGVGGFMSAIFADRVGLPMVVASSSASPSPRPSAACSAGSPSSALGTIFIGILTLAFSLSFDSMILGRSDLLGRRRRAASRRRDRDRPARARAAVLRVARAVSSSYLVVFRMLQRSRPGGRSEHCATTWSPPSWRASTWRATGYRRRARLGDARPRRRAVRPRRLDRAARRTNSGGSTCACHRDARLRRHRHRCWGRSSAPPPSPGSMSS